MKPKAFMGILFRIFSLFVILFFPPGLFPETKKTIHSKSFILGDIQSGKIIYKKNENKKFPIASVVKIITAIIAENHLEEDSSIKIPDKKLILNNLESRANIEIGEEYKLKDLLYGLLLPSGNDIARVLDWELQKKNLDFSTLANEWISNNKLSNSSFPEPIGLSPDTSSTATDLWKILNIIYQHDVLYEILNTESYTFLSKNKRKIHVVTRNPLLQYKKFFIRGKTGTTKKAGQCFIGFIQKDKNAWGVVLLGAKDIKSEMKNMIDKLEEKKDK